MGDAQGRRVLDEADCPGGFPAEGSLPVAGGGLARSLMCSTCAINRQVDLLNTDICL